MKDFPEKDPTDPRSSIILDPGPSTSAGMVANSHLPPAIPLMPHQNDLPLLPQLLSEKDSSIPTAHQSNLIKDSPTLSRSNSLAHSIDMERAALGIPGPLEDPDLPKPARNLSDREGVQNKSVSSSLWSNVRLSLNLSPLAASQLEHKASAASSLLSRLGLLNLQIGQSTPVTLSAPASTSVPTKLSPTKTEKKRKPRTQPNAATLPKHPVPGMTENHPVPGGINGDASAMVVVQHLLNHIAQQRNDGKSISLPSAGSSINDVQHLQPNVVATASQPIPLPSSVTTTLTAPTGPFPFSSMTKVAYTLKSTLASSHVGTSSTVTTVEAVRESSSVSTITAVSPAQKPKTSHQRNIALTSPLLVNLLQGNEIPAPLTVPTVKKTKRKRPDKSPTPSSPMSSMPTNLILPVKKPPRQRKKKKIEEEIVNGSSPIVSLPPPVPPIIFRPPPPEKNAKSSPPKNTLDLPGHAGPVTSASSATYMVFAISTPGSTPTKSSPSITWSVPGNIPVDIGGNVVTTPVLVNSLEGIGSKGVQLITPPGNGRKTPKLVMVRPPPGKEGGGTPNADNSTSSLDSGISLGIGTDDHTKGRPVGPMTLVPESGLELKVGPESECPS